MIDVPGAASRIQLQPVFVKTVTLKVIDVGGNLLTENAVVKFWTSPTDSVVLIDNAPQDLDPTGGKVVSMTPPNGFVPYTVADGGASPLDYDNTVNGAIQFRSAAGAGVHSWCETVAPVGYAFANPGCGTLDAKFEGEYAIVLKHKAL